MHKNLSTVVIPKTTSRFEVAALGKNPHAINHIIGIAHKDQSEEIMQPSEDKHM